MLEEFLAISEFFDHIINLILISSSWESKYRKFDEQKEYIIILLLLCNF